MGLGRRREVVLVKEETEGVSEDGREGAMDLDFCWRRRSLPAV